MNNSTHTAEQALTQHVRLILDNDEALYFTRRELVAGFLESEDAQYPHLFGDQLKNWCERLIGLEDDEMNLFQREVLSTALAFVDWRAMAEDYIEEEREG